MAVRGTPALRILAATGTPHRVHEYEHDTRAGPYGLEAAAKLGVEPERVFKTLVTLVGDAAMVVVVPVERQVDLRKLGRHAAMAPPRQAARLTGYVVGGISPLGQRRRLPTLLDESALAHPTVFVSGGRRGLEIELAPGDLLALTGGRAATVASAR